MSHEDTSSELVKMEEVDLKPDYIVCDSMGYVEKKHTVEQTGVGNESVNSSYNYSKLSLNTYVHVKEEIITQQNSDEPEIYQDEEIKDFNKQDTKVKIEIDISDGIIPMSEDGIQNNIKTEIKIEKIEESETDSYVEDNPHIKETSNTKNNESCNILVVTNSQKSEEKSDSKNQLHQKTKIYTCNYCTYKGVYRGNFIEHLRIHTGEKPYPCTFCDYRSAQKSRLTTHLRIHTGEKPFSCELCEYKCVAKSRLTKHLRVHTGEKPFSCKFCVYKCKEKSKLTIHMRTHTGEKPFSCKFCDFKCKTHTELKKHIRIHTGEKPYSCKFCEYRGVTATQLKVHLRKHADKLPSK